MKNISCQMPYFCKINHLERINALHRYRKALRRLLILNSTASFVTRIGCHVPQKITLYYAVQYQFLWTIFTFPPTAGTHPSHILSFEMCRIEHTEWWGASWREISKR